MSTPVLPPKPRLSRLFRRCARTALLLPLMLGLGGCNFIHNYGSGTHLDTPAEKPAKRRNTAKASTMLIDVTTNAEGQVVSVDFVRSSGSAAVDNFVADSIRHDFPGNPSTRTRVEVNYSPADGFSQPKLISSTPLT